MLATMTMVIVLRGGAAREGDARLLSESLQPHAQKLGLDPESSKETVKMF